MSNKPWENEEIAANGRSVRENFGQWFGQSHAVDENGDPLVLYHGTLAEFDAFDLDFASSRTMDGAGQLGFYFTSSHDVALFFTDDYNAEQVLHVHLSIQSPFTVSAKEFELKYADMGPNEAKGFRAQLEWRGYDGIHVKKDASTGFVDSQDDVWIAFYPTQIKFAKNNSGLYLKESSSMSDAFDALALEAANQAKAACRPIKEGLSP